MDTELYLPAAVDIRWDLGYLGAYSEDRQPGLDLRLLEPARRRRDARFVVAGPHYPETLAWPRNVHRIPHLPPAAHRAFYNAQRFTLNLTRADLLAAGHSPNVRPFEAAACGIPIISDRWAGLETFFEPGREILVADSAEAVERHLHELPLARSAELGIAARARVLREHSAQHRAAELERYLREVAGDRPPHRSAFGGMPSPASAPAAPGPSPRPSGASLPAPSLASASSGSSLQAPRSLPPAS